MIRPLMRRYFPELLALPLLPILIAQGRRARRAIPRLPEAAGERQGLAQPAEGFAAAPFRLLAIGESPVAGVGVATQEEAIAAALARELARHLRQPVAWEAWGINGITAAQAREQLLPRIPPRPVDLAFLAFGVNDTTAFQAVARWAENMKALVEGIEARCRPTAVLLSGVPPIARFPALPRPLREVLGLKAGVLDRSLRELAMEKPHRCHVPLTIDPGVPALMASDGYHPSAAGCDAWARALVHAAGRRLGTLLVPT